MTEPVAWRDFAAELMELVERLRREIEIQPCRDSGGPALTEALYDSVIALEKCAKVIAAAEEHVKGQWDYSQSRKRLQDALAALSRTGEGKA